jgi:hypothetical protein
LTPSIGVSEEYNDNIFSDNRDRVSDFITTFSPAITLIANDPSYELRAGYSFGADLYAKESELNNAFNRQNLIVNGLYRATRGLTLNVAESLEYDRYTSVVGQQSFSTGRQESWSNTITPGLSWQVSARDSLHLDATYSALRFLGSGTGVDSNTYTANALFSHDFTRRLAGTVGYVFTYLDISGQGQEPSATHIPTVGFNYRLTSTLTANIRGGPAITTIGSDTSMTPGGYASLVQVFSFGSLTLEYTRAVTVASGFGGTNDTQTASGTLVLSGLQRDLLIVFNPSYTISESIGTRQTGEDVEAFTLNLGLNYQIARYTTLFGGYTFLHQRTSRTLGAQPIDVDQNRLRFGLQFGYPFSFD